MATATTQEFSVATAPPVRYAKQFDLLSPEYEVLDPNPDLHVLFSEYNALFFDGKLAGCEVKWSSRMTLCEPLLKLRPRSDMINTLLHEMIHAFVFVYSRVKDHDDHGAVFQSHMHRINQTAGTQITVFHSFHDEVDSYRQHWWKCSGPCQRAPPYYGVVKRAMNRPPGSTDRWWDDHQKNCGGSYEKIKDPPGFKEKQEKKLKKQLEAAEKKKKKEAAATPSVKNFFRTAPATANEKRHGEGEAGATQASKVVGAKGTAKKPKGSKTPAPSTQKGTGKEETKPKAKKPRVEKPADPNSRNSNNPTSPRPPTLPVVSRPPPSSGFPIPSDFSGFPVVFSMGNDEFYLVGDIHALFQKSSQTPSASSSLPANTARASSSSGADQVVDLTFSDDDDDEEKAKPEPKSSSAVNHQKSSVESQASSSELRSSAAPAEVIEIE